MSLVIPITGVAQDFRVPGAYGEILFGQGPANAPASTREIVLAMPMISTGTWTAGTLYEIKNEETAEDGGGAGSPIHRAARVSLRANKTARLWGLPVAETVTGSPAAATTTVVYANAATGAGTAIVTICGEECSHTFASGDSADSIGEGIEAAINSKTFLPCTANNSSGTVTVTAKLKGISQGTGTLGAIRIRATITSGVGTTSTLTGSFLGAVQAGAEGTTTEAANLATALANIKTTRKYFVVTSAMDATSMGHIKTHVNTKSEPRQGLRSVGVGAYPGTLANCTTIATGLNFERFRLAWQENSDFDPCSIAANVAAVLQKREQVDTAFNFNGYGASFGDWLVPGVFSDADRPDTDDQNDAINDGITCIATNDSGSYIVMSCSTRSKNSAGTVDDFRATQSRVVSVADEFVDEQTTNFILNHGSKKFKDDERLADGTVNPNQRLIRGVVTPSQVIADLKRQMDAYEAAGKLQNVAATKESIRTAKTGGRLECGYDLEVINWLDQGTFRVAEISTG